MPRIDYRAELNLLVAVRGHPFERDAFARLFDGFPGITATMVDQPAAALLMTPEMAAAFDVLVLYDMPGLDLAEGPVRPRIIDPDPRFKEGFARLLDAGKGVLALHHALAAWPSWPEYADWLGGRFLYRPGEVRGVPRPDSGYRHEARHGISVVADHPVTRGLPPRFEMTDELYLAQVFEEDVQPLLRSDFDFVDGNFWSAAAAMDGRLGSREGWSHPRGSSLVGWIKRARRSPLVYLQPGDGPSAYDDPHYRALVENAVRWLASDEARRWARSA